MKKVILIFAVALVGLTACNKFGTSKSTKIDSTAVTAQTDSTAHVDTTANVTVK